MAEPNVGADAPDFSLKSTSGEQVSVSQFKGQKNVLIAFFPLAFTGVCTAENCSFSEDYSKFEGDGHRGAAGQRRLRPRP